MNFIDTIQNLNKLHSLNILSLCGNRISSCVDWHLELGNLVSLNLSQNSLKKLNGLDKMYSLVSLDLSCNQIEELDEVDHIGDLPCLENLRLTGNPIAGSVGKNFLPLFINLCVVRNIIKVKIFIQIIEHVFSHVLEIDYKKFSWTMRKGIKLNLIWL